MSENISWNNESIEVLQKTTRDLKFDWNAISSVVSEYFLANNQQIIVTPQICRQQYAIVQSLAPVKVKTVPFAGDLVEKPTGSFCESIIFIASFNQRLSLFVSSRYGYNQHH